MATRSMSHCQGKGSLSHNNRGFIPKNVDPGRTKDNVTYVSQTLTDAYEECFRESMRRYNEAQPRADRRIENYYSSLFGEAKQKSVATGANKQKSFYEALVQIGDMNDSGVGTPDGELAAKCLDEYMRGFQKRNPQFHVFNAVLHMDEATPHLHIDYIPVAEQKKGMDRQNGIAKALEQMGHGKGKDAINRWRIAERRELEHVCNRHGIEISETKPSRGSIPVEVYKEMKEAVRREVSGELIAERDAIASEVSDLQNKRDSVLGEVNALAKQERGLKRKFEGLQGQLREAEDKIVAVEEKEKWANGVIERLKPVAPVRTVYRAVSQWEKDNNSVSAVQDHSMSRGEIDKRSGKTILGGARTVGIDDYNALMNNHELLEANIVEREIAESRYRELVPRYNKAVKERRLYKSSHDALARLPESEQRKIHDSHAVESERERKAREASAKAVEERARQSTITGRLQENQRRVQTERQQPRPPSRKKVDRGER